jgi:hypothetical protein
MFHRSPVSRILSKLPKQLCVIIYLLAEARRSRSCRATNTQGF